MPCEYEDPTDPIIVRCFSPSANVDVEVNGVVRVLCKIPTFPDYCIQGGSMCQRPSPLDASRRTPEQLFRQIHARTAWVGFFVDLVLSRVRRRHPSHRTPFN
jgi:hypothetical protein